MMAELSTKKSTGQLNKKEFIVKWLMSLKPNEYNNVETPPLLYGRTSAVLDRPGPSPLPATSSLDVSRGASLDESTAVAMSLDESGAESSEATVGMSFNVSGIASLEASLEMSRDVVSSPLPSSKSTFPIHRALDLGLASRECIPPSSEKYFGPLLLSKSWEKDRFEYGDTTSSTSSDSCSDDLEDETADVVVDGEPFASRGVMQNGHLKKIHPHCFKHVKGISAKSMVLKKK